MIESDFYRSETAKAVRFSGSEFQFGVEALDHAVRQGTFGAKPVHQQGAMLAQHACDFLHGLDARAHRPSAPSVEERAGPVRRDVVPEELELFFQQVGAHGPEVVLQEPSRVGGLAFRSSSRGA